jgi:2-oxoglutarate ferredoxin oxidoreductase subunit delta
MKIPFLHPNRSLTNFVQLNTRICQACWRCINECNKNVIGKVDFLGHRHARIDNPDQCAGCLKCVKICKFGAFKTIHQPSGEITMYTIVEKKLFNKRAFTSIALLLSGLVLPISGIMNHQLQFDPLTQARHFWMSVHNMSAFLFTIFAITHVALNWRSLIHYVKKAKGVIISMEAVAAVALVASIVGIFVSHVFHVN